MDQKNSLAKILNLLSNNLSYNLLVLATQQLFSLAANNPAKNFAVILDFYKGLMNTDAESTRTILPEIIIPRLLKFYNTHKEAINEFIIAQRQRLKEIEEKERNADICVVEEAPKSTKKNKKTKKRDSKHKSKAGDQEEEKEDSLSNDKNTTHNGSGDEVNENTTHEKAQLFNDLTHNLNDDSSLFQIDDFDLNYIVFHCRPLVLSTDAQLEEACEKEMLNVKGGKQKTKGVKGKSKNKRFDTLSTIENLAKKEADTVGSLQTKSVSIQSVLENSCKRSVKEFLKSNAPSSKHKKQITSRRSKRLKNEVQVDEDLVENVYFDPIMSLFFYLRKHMLSEKWTVRQYCCANLLCLMHNIKMQDYLTLVPDLTEVDSLAECLTTDLATRAIILTLMDHFSDFQENRLLAPVRELSVQLMIPCIHIIPVKAVCGTILSSNKLYWMYKYNVLLILKTILVEGK